jgi:LPS-assembly protein
VKYKNILLIVFLTWSFNSFSQTDKRVNFSFGNKVQVLSDKAYRKTKDNEFEAVGNVIINHESNAIYGEKASISFKSGEAEVLGNVRYISSDMTVFGSKMEYNFNSSYLGIYNGRIVSKDYVVVGKYLAKISDDVFVGEEAEYTTCRDCPESWSILGKKVYITQNEYIKIKHAYIKVNGVVVMYIPYMVLPIKKERESGFLFPKFKIDSNEGVKFGLPYFWAISENQDATITPLVEGKRGVGGELQYRHKFREETWMEFNSLSVNDRIWEAEKTNTELSGEHNLRHTGDYEHHSFLGNWINHHAYFSGMSDLDTVRDFDRFSNDRLRTTDAGLETFINVYTPLVDISAEAEFKRNLLHENAKGFDHDYVQTLPKINVDTIPFYLLQGDKFGLKSLSVQWNSDFNVFKQNHVNEGTYIRNANRLNIQPKLQWDLGYIGPVNVKSSVVMDRQQYWFPEEQVDDTFQKQGFVYENEVSFELKKIFGLSYDQSIPLETIDLDKSKNLDIDRKNKDIRFNNVLGTVPNISETFTDDKYKVVRNSYKHSQIYKLKHYYISSQKTKGNADFLKQIESENGQFDSIDAIREKENELNQISSRTSLPLSNTLELQWNNSIIKKSSNKFNIFKDGRHLRDNFGYSRVAYFDISQGYDFNIDRDKFADGLTRLYTGAGFSVGSFSYTFSEYFFHKNNEHLLAMGIGHTVDNFYYGLTFNYDSFTTPVNKNAELNTTFRINSVLHGGLNFFYDIEKEEFTKSYYQLLYSPTNNCWKADLKYETTEIEKSIRFNFYVNFGAEGFSSVSGM